MSDFLGTSDAEEKPQEESKDLSSLFKFSTEDNSDVFVQETEDKKPTIDDIIPQPKPLDEYDEVLKDDERIDVPLYTGSQNLNTVEYVNSENNGSFIQKPTKKPVTDYKDKLADLYTDTSKVNPYNKPLEQETVSLDSEELFESPKPVYKPKFSSDLETLQDSDVVDINNSAFDSVESLSFSEEVTIATSVPVSFFEKVNQVSMHDGVILSDDADLYMSNNFLTVEEGYYERSMPV